MAKIGDITRMASPVTPEQIAALPPEFRALLQAVIDHYERRIAALEAELAVTKQELAATKKELTATKKTPRNSSLPPSSEHPHAKPVPEKPKSGRKPGGQPGHAKHERALIPTADCQQMVPCRPTHCRGCGHPLAGSDSAP